MKYPRRRADPLERIQLCIAAGLPTAVGESAAAEKWHK